MLCLAAAGHCYASGIDKLKTAFLQGDYKNAIIEGERLIARDKGGGPAQTEELYLYLGLSYLKDANYLRASDIFEIILREFKESRFKDEAGLSLADTYFLRQDYDAARGRYEKLIEDSSYAKFKPLVYWRLSQTGFKLGDTESGKRYLDKLKQEFPQSAELFFDDVASEASAKLYYTVQVGYFSSSVNAANLTQKLIRKGYPAFSEEVNQDGKLSYRVRVGKSPTRKEALGLAGRLTQDGFPTRICP